MILGLILFIAPKFMATITYVQDREPPTIEQYIPYGSQSDPMIVVKSASFNIIMQVIDDVKITNVWCEIYNPDNDNLLQNITDNDWTYEIDTDTKKRVTYLYTAPNSECYRKFIFKAKDIGGNIETKIGWLYVGNINGKFYINNAEATSETHITVYNPNIKFKFIATSGEDLIDKVWIEITKGDSYRDELILTKSSTDTWEIDYTLQWGVGDYNVVGYITVSNKDYRLMTITMPYGVEIENIETIGIFEIFKPIQWIGIATMIMGIIIYVKGGKQHE